MPTYKVTFPDITLEHDASADEVLEMVIAAVIEAGRSGWRIQEVPTEKEPRT